MRCLTQSVGLRTSSWRGRPSSMILKNPNEAQKNTHHMIASVAERASTLNSLKLVIILFRLVSMKVVWRKGNGR